MIEGKCDNNKFILCEEHHCKFCGWNPKVDEARREQIRSEFTEAPYQLQLRVKVRSNNE